MKIYSKLLSKIRNNKARVKKVVGIISVVVLLKYDKITSIPTSLSSNSTQQVEQVESYVEEDTQVMHTDRKVIKTGSGILIGKEREFNLLEENDQQVVLVKFESNPVTPPTNRGPSNFPTQPTGGRPSPPVYIPNYRTPANVVPGPGLGAGANPAGAGGGGGAAEFDDQGSVPENKKSQESKSHYDYHDTLNAPKKKKQSQDQCSIDEQNKAGIDELPDSSKFIYNLETKTSRKELKRVWKNPEAKKEVLANLDKMNNGKLVPRNHKNFKGFKTLKELKFTKTRMLVKIGINGDPDQIIAIFMRRDLDDVVLKFKGKYK